MADKRMYDTPVTGAASIKQINAKIRVKILRAKSRKQLTDLVAESRYLYTLTYSPTFKEAIRGKTEGVRKAAKSQFTTTARLANRKLMSKKIKGKPYDTIIGRGK